MNEKIHFWYFSIGSAGGYQAFKCKTYKRFNNKNKMKAKQTIYFKRQALGLTIPTGQALTLSHHMVIVCQRLLNYKSLSGRSIALRKERVDGMGNSVV